MACLILSLLRSHYFEGMLCLTILSAPGILKQDTSTFRIGDFLRLADEAQNRLAIRLTSPLIGSQPAHFSRKVARQSRLPFFIRKKGTFVPVQ
jgi:hypothetical protein